THESDTDGILGDHVARHGARRRAAERIVRPDPRALASAERAVHCCLCQEPGRSADHQAVTRRVERAGARRDGRPRGRRRDARARARHRRHPQGRPDRRRLAEAAAERLGAVHLTWENEARLEVQEAGGELEIVNPPTSILATPPVAVVDANAKRHGTEAAAKAYLEYLYTDDGQEIIAKNFYRPVKPEVL